MNEIHKYTKIKYDQSIFPCFVRIFPPQHHFIYSILKMYCSLFSFYTDPPVTFKCGTVCTILCVRALFDPALVTGVPTDDTDTLCL